MISFKEYCNINEDVVKPWKIKIIRDEEVLPLLEGNKEFLSALEKGGMIYRGFSYLQDAERSVILDSTHSIRTSRDDTSNAYQVCMDYSDKNKGMPSRSNSFICSTNVAVAQRYFLPRVMVPMTPAAKRLAVSTSSDFWSARSASNFYTGNVIDSGDVVKKFILKAGASIKSPWTIEQMKQVDAFLVKKYPGDAGRRELSKIWWYMTAPWIKDPAEVFTTAKSPLKEIADACFSKDSIVGGLNIEPYGNPLVFDREVWFSGKTLSIPIPTFKELVKKLEKKGHLVHVGIKHISAQNEY